MRRMLFVVISVMLLISTALAYMVSTWTVANSMTVIKRDVNITAYSDEACTKPLTSLSWGEIKQADRAEKIFWIKNVGKDNGTAAWDSDLELVTFWSAYDEMYYWDETSEEWVYWWRPEKLLNLTPSPTPGWEPWTINITLPWMEPGDVVKVKYVIEVGASCEPGDYSWTLYLGWI